MTHHGSNKMTRMLAASAFAGGVVLLGTAAIAQTMTFPSRSGSLANDSYWAVTEFSEGCCTLDLNVRRWDGSAWRGGRSGTDNDDDFTWNAPYFAPVSGEVASCWRNFPDNPQQGVKVLDVDGDGVNDIFTGGNSVTIITDDGLKVGMSHFKAGSIPAALCPNNAGTAQFPDTMEKVDGWRVAAFIEKGSRPKVTEGQFLGRAGNSGNSTGPHLHISVKRITGTSTRDGVTRETFGPSIPMPIRNAWAKSYDSAQNTGDADWWRLRGVGFRGNADCNGNFTSANKEECGFKFIHPSPFLRRGSASAGTTGFVETAFMGPDRVISAVKDSNGNLKLIAWDLDESGTFTRRGDINAGAIKSVKLSSPEPGHILAAVRQADDRLKMIAYRVSAGGSFTRVADRIAGRVSGLEVATVEDIRPVRDNQRRFETVTVTAVRTEQNTLKIIAWDLNVQGNGTVSVERLAEASAGTVGTVAIGPSKHFYGLYTAVSDSNQNLKVIPWTLATNLQSFTRKTSASAGEVGPHIGVAPLASGLAVAVRDSNGQLRVITWDVANSGNVTDRKDTFVAGSAFQIRVLAAPDAGGSFSTVSRGADGRVSLIGWAADSDGTRLRRIGSSRMGTSTGISAATALRSYSRMKDRGMIATGVIQSNGTLKVTAWDTNLLP